MNDSQLNKIQTDALSAKAYDALLIRRFEKNCFLVIEINGEAHVHVNESGKPKQYRHVWQIKDWLKERFNISPDEVALEQTKF